MSRPSRGAAPSPSRRRALPPQRADRPCRDGHRLEDEGEGAKLSRHGLTGRTIAPPSPSPPTSAPCSFMASITCASPTRERYTGHSKRAATSSTMRLVEALTTTGPVLRSSQRWTTRTTVASADRVGMPCSSTTKSRSASASCAKPTSAPDRRTRSPSAARLASSGSGLAEDEASPPALTETTSQPRAPSRRSVGAERDGASGVHGDHESPRPDALDVDRSA